MIAHVGAVPLEELLAAFGGAAGALAGARVFASGLLDNALRRRDADDRAASAGC